MKTLVPIICCGLITFLVSFQIFRSVMLPSAAEQADANATANNATAAGVSNIEPNRNRDRDPAAGTGETLRVPPLLIESLSVTAFDANTGEFKPELLEMLDLNADELASSKRLFDSHFQSHATAELAVAKVLPAGEKPDPRRVVSIRIEPLDDRLIKESTNFRAKFIELLGRPRGLAAAGMIGRQLGNHGQGGEVVTFLSYPNESNYRLQVTGVGNGSGTSISGPVYDAPDFSRLARYRHLQGLVHE